MKSILEKMTTNRFLGVLAGACQPEASIIYSEMLTDFERIGDHMLNIAQAYSTIGTIKD
jgi:phosphate:Na+ symporter